MVWPGFLIDPLRGKTSLAKVFWLYCFGSSVMYKVIGWLAGPQSQAAVVVYLLGGVALAILQFAMLWRCAYNTRYRSLGTLIRTCVVAALLTMPFLLYDILTNPRAFIASKQSLEGTVNGGWLRAPGAAPCDKRRAGW